MSKHHFSPRPVPKAPLVPDPPEPVAETQAETPDEVPKASTVFREAVDLRLTDGKWHVVVVAYGGGGYAERVIFTSSSGNEAASRFLAASKKKCMPALGFNLGADAERL